MTSNVQEWSSKESESSPLIDEKERSSVPTVKVYRKRWLVLAIFSAHMFFVNWMWAGLSPVADLIACYYHLDLFWVNMLPLAAMIVYAVGFLPISYFLDYFGLRLTAAVGGCFICAAAWCRYAGADPGLFWMLMLGSCLSYVTNTLEWSAPAMLSSLWFPQNERGAATTTFVALVPQFGILAGLLISPMVIQSPDTEIVCSENVSRTSQAFVDWQTDINQQMQYYMLAQAILTSLVLPFSFFVPDAPPSPPSTSTDLKQSNKKLHETSNFFRSIVEMLKNKQFVLYMMIFSVFMGGTSTYVTIYDEILYHTGYDGYQDEVGYLGIAIQLACALSLFVICKWIDWTRTFFATSMAICVATVLLLAAFSATIQFKLHFLIVCILATLAITGTVSIQAVAYEFVVEMTYPAPESLSTGFINGMSSVLTVPMIIGLGEMIEKGMAVYCNWLCTGLFVLAWFAMFFVRPVLRRVKLDVYSKESETASQS